MPAAPFEITIVLSNTMDRLTVSAPPHVASCYERLWHAGDEAAVPESCCRQSSHSVALAGRSSKVTPRSGNTCAGSEPPSLTIAARYSNVCPRASRRLRRCDFPASTWAPCGVIDLPGGRYTGKVPRSSASRPSEFASYGCWATSLGSTPVEIECRIAARHSRLMWVLADVVGLFSIKVGPFSANVGLDQRIFSANLGPKRRMLSGQAVYVLGPLHIWFVSKTSSAGWKQIHAHRLRWF
jgi:hypothetical protein